MSIYYALAGWSGNREDERTKRKREKEKTPPDRYRYGVESIRISYFASITIPLLPAAGSSFNCTPESSAVTALSDSGRAARGRKLSQ
ncbi:hypothetical protein EVAR_9265_1 [Eumeta japonica]|uniref:Uncharacterized protein n=1 Tax=Eumeta variegata TaxID=151549 RepID=A0A4C1TLV1_EUMVA|nr:hypothetical protein EVAR_9265_1 [Eumeta japonica]